MASQLAVGGGDHADVDASRPRSRRPGRISRTWSALSNLAWKGAGGLAHLVEEEGSAVGLLEQARPIAVGAGEGAPGVAEELALEQGVREGRAVDGDEGVPASRARRRWMACATSSLPVPVSPVTSTVAWERAATPISAKTFCISGPAADDAPRRIGRGRRPEPRAARSERAARRRPRSRVCRCDHLGWRRPHVQAAAAARPASARKAHEHGELGVGARARAVPPGPRPRTGASSTIARRSLRQRQLRRPCRRRAPRPRRATAHPPPSPPRSAHRGRSRESNESGPSRHLLLRPPRWGTEQVTCLRVVSRDARAARPRRAVVGPGGRRRARRDSGPVRGVP